MKSASGCTWVTPYIKDLTVERLVLDGRSVHSDCLRLPESDSMIIWHESFPGEFSGIDNIKVVSRFGAGIDNIDFGYCSARGITVFHVPDYGVDEVSDSALAMILARSRGIFEYSAMSLDICDGTWESNIIPSLQRTSEVTVGIVGLGSIGKALALKLSAIGYKVKFFDPYVPPGIAKVVRGERVKSLEQLFLECKIISLNCPLTSETRGMVSIDLLKRFKDRELQIVNTSRGGVAPSLAEILTGIKEGFIYSYDTDVLPNEPPAQEELCLIKRDSFLRSRITINPHVAFYSTQSFSEMRLRAATNISEFFSGTESGGYRCN